MPTSRAAALAALVSLLAPYALDRALPPEAAPPLQVGDHFASVVEGMAHEVLELTPAGPRLRTRLAPGASGPPVHLHRGFDEVFVVSEGILTLRVDGVDHRVGPGGRFTVPAGTPHQPRNDGDVAVVLEPPTGAASMPADFGAELRGLYAAMDAVGAADHPRVLLQLAAQPSPVDTWLVGPPVPVQRALRALLRPIARLVVAPAGLSPQPPPA